MDAEITIEKLEMTQLMNGATADTRKANAIDPSARSWSRCSIAPAKLGNVSSPKEAEAHSASVRQLLSGAYGLVNAIPNAR